MAPRKNTKKNPAPSKNKTTTAVAKVTPEDMAEISNILDLVNMDIGNAQIGKVFALRAGVGLIIVKDMCLHGEWKDILPKAMPHRSPRTLRGYQKDAKDWLEQKGLKATDVWNGLYDFNPAVLTQENGRLMLPKGGSKDSVPEAAKQLAEYLNEKSEEKEAEKGNNGGDDPKPKKLSRKQRRESAAGDMTLAVVKVNAAINNSDWTLVDTETLDTVASSLTVVAAQIKEELKKRG